jgi:hypothetical protein
MWAEDKRTSLLVWNMRGEEKSFYDIGTQSPILIGHLGKILSRISQAEGVAQ